MAQRMNAMDILLIGILFGGLLVGFSQGMVRAAIMIVAFYLSVVLASLYFPLVGVWVQGTFGSPPLVAQYLGFIIVVLIAFAALTFAGVYTLRYVEIGGRFALLDKLIGAFLGLILATLIGGFLAMLLWNLMVIRDGRNFNLPLFQWLGGQVFSSVLIGLFANNILPVAYEFARPLLPASAQILLDPITR